MKSWTRWTTIRGSAARRGQSPRRWGRCALVCALVTVGTLCALGATSLAAAAPGDRLWLSVMGSSANPAAFRDVVVAGDGSVYAVGNRSIAGVPEVLLARHSSDGTRRWAVTWRSKGGAWASFVATAPGGGVYVAGTALTGTPGASDIVCLKYSAAGKRLWTRRYSGPAGLDNDPAGLATDDSGNVYIVGSSTAAGGSRQGTVTLKFSARGVLRWVQRLDPDTTDPKAGHISPAGIALDGDLDVYVAVTTEYFSANTASVVKYDGQDGAQLASSGGFVIVGSETAAQALAVRDGRVVLGGWYKPWDVQYAGVHDFLVERLDTQLQSKWSALLPRLTTAGDACHDLAIDGDGSSYAVGVTRSDAMGWNVSRAALAKVSPDGTLAWSLRYVPNGITDAEFDHVAVATGCIYAAGWSWVDSQKDLMLLCFSTSGQKRWEASWSSSAWGYDEPEALAVAPSCLYVAGHGKDTALLLKYAR